jgi:hypothetical protein
MAIAPVILMLFTGREAWTAAPNKCQIDDDILAGVGAALQPRAAGGTPASAYGIGSEPVEYTYSVPAPNAATFVPLTNLQTSCPWNLCPSSPRQRGARYDGY